MGVEVYGKNTDSMTAPVLGSRGLPACTARVPKFCRGEGARGGVSIDPSPFVAWGDISTVMRRVYFLSSLLQRVCRAKDGNRLYFCLHMLIDAIEQHDSLNILTD